MFTLPLVSSVLVRRVPALLLLLSALLWPRLASAALGVVATTPDLGVVARAVGGARVQVSVLALDTQDPHWVDPKPHLALALARADLLLVTGAELETGWLPTLQTGARNGRIQTGGAGYLDCSTLVSLLEVPSGKIDRSAGDIHPTGNPHYMLDPRAVERVAVGIGKRLANLDPPGRATYLANTKRFVGELRSAQLGWEKTLTKIRGTKIVGYHRSLAYLANWLGLRAVAALEPKPGVAPSPRHVATLIELARAEGAKLVMQEAWFPTTTSKIVAEKAGLRLVVIPGMPRFAAGQSYVAFLDGIVRATAGSLE